MNRDVEVQVDYPRAQIIADAAVVASFLLPLSAIIVACCVCFSAKMRIPVENAVILLVASLFILVVLRSEPWNNLQKIAGFYLISVCANELAFRHFRAFFLPAGVSVSYTVLVLSLCAIGYLVGKISAPVKLRDSESTNILYSWLVVSGIILVHMGVLTVLLGRFYAYGYDRNVSVLGNLCLYLLLFILLWQKLGKVRFRQFLGLVYATFYLVLILVKH